MTDLHDIVERAVNSATDEQQGLGHLRTRIADFVTAELEAHADEVRVHMEMQVWGMVR